MSEIPINHDCYCTICGASAGALSADNARLTSELAEARDKQDRWYSTEARLHGLLTEVCGNKAYGEAVGRLCDPTLAEHNPIIAERDALRAQVAGLREALEDTAESLAVALGRLGVCGEGDGADHRADAHSWGGTAALAKARAALAGPTTAEGSGG